MIKKSIIIFCFLTFILANDLFSSDCGCDGSSISGIVPIGGTTNIGILKKNNFRLMTFYKFSYGNQYYSGDSKAIKGTTNYFASNYLGLVLGYGLYKNLTVETEIGGFPNKTQDYFTSESYGSGLSHLLLSAKYGIYKDSDNEFEITLGAGGRIPLERDSSVVPLHVRASTGSYGLVFQAFLHKGFTNSGFHLFFINRTEINGENKQNYYYGPAFYNSFYIAKNLFDEFSGILELRLENKLYDESYDTRNPDSGGSFIIISPQINYSLENWNFSALFDYPIYQYYNGYQLGRAFSAAVNITYKFSFE